MALLLPIAVAGPFADLLRPLASRGSLARIAIGRTVNLSRLRILIRIRAVLMRRRIPYAHKDPRAHKDVLMRIRQAFQKIPVYG